MPKSVVQGAGAPTVSIVITSYNYERYVGDTIRSALGQTYPHAEVIVVDDGSTDGSRAVLESYRDSCRVIYRANGGEAAASHSGLLECRGDLVLFLDSDDMLDKDAIARVVEAWRPGCTKVQFYLRTIDGVGRPLGFRTPNIPFVPDDEIEDCLLDYGYYPSPPTSGNVYTRDFLLKVLPAPAWRNGIDGYLNALAALEGRVITIPEELGSYRMHDANMSAISTMTLPKLRQGMIHEIERERAIVHWAAERGIQIYRPLVAHIPSHCKARILSLRLDPASHPIRGDRLGGLALTALASIWRYRHMTLAKRLLSTAGVAGLLILPKDWLMRRLQALFVAEKRRGLADLLRLAAAREMLRAWQQQVRRQAARVF